MKKFLAVFLCIILAILPVLASPAGAVGYATKKSSLPTIEITGDGEPIWYDNETKSFILKDFMSHVNEGGDESGIYEAAANLLFPLLMEGVVLDKWDNYYDALQKEVADIFDPVSLDENGNPVEEPEDGAAAAETPEDGEAAVEAPEEPVEAPETHDADPVTPGAVEESDWTDGAASGTAIDGAINPAYSLTVTEADEGAGFYCVVGNDLGAVTSSTAKLTLTMPPEIIKNPPNHSVKSGTRVAFTVEATGATTFQWYYKTRSSTAKWTAVSTSGSSTVNNDPDNSHSTLYFTASTTYNGYRYYCVVSNGSGSVDSTVGTLTVTAGGSTRTTSTRTATPRPAATAAATAGTNLVTPAPTPVPTPTPTPTATPTPSPTPIITTSPSPRATATPLPTMPPEPPDAGSVLPWVFAVLAAILLGWMYVMLRRAQEQLKQKQG